MTDTEIDIAVAKELGYDCDPIIAREWKSRGQWIILPNGSQEDLRSKNMDLPKFSQDLNACAEFEKKLCSVEDRHAYYVEIDKICLGAINNISASAETRCIAFLKLKGKYKETA